MRLGTPRWWNCQYKKIQLRHLSRRPRYSAGCSRILGPPFAYNDAATFAGNYRDIFIREIYRFRATTEAPFIVDCGANTGLGIVYAKKIYPASKIVAFEPDPRVFELLTRNVRTFGFNDVRLEQKAVWKETTQMSFYSEGADAGRICRPLKSCNRLEVNAVRLGDYLDREVNFLKLDIEGAETEVILDCAEKLRQVQTLFVEYHSFESELQRLSTLLGCLEDNGFRLYIEGGSYVNSPLLARASNHGMDCQFNIFGYRVSSS